MNTFPLIKKALSGLGVPAEPINYTGSAPEYIVYTEADNRTTLFGSDEEIEDTSNIQVSFYTKNRRRLRPMQLEIKSALRTAGFLPLEMLEWLEQDTGYYHAVVEASIDGAPDGGEGKGE